MIFNPYLATSNPNDAFIVDRFLLAMDAKGYVCAGPHDMMRILGTIII